jgi:hypothetical protein
MSEQRIITAAEVQDEMRKELSIMAETPIGQIIDLSAQVVGRRGAVATYRQDLCDLMANAFQNGQAVAVTGFAVLRAKYDSDEAYQNAKQARGADLRKHAKRVLEQEGMEGRRVSINWHPDTGVPQVALKAA